ncbi:MAG: hypothetical protein KIT82_23505, partial [Bradyrhizobium sp.]|nr:hypothetical protein [Bradyrhizobium sp.]
PRGRRCGNPHSGCDGLSRARKRAAPRDRWRKYGNRRCEALQVVFAQAFQRRRVAGHVSERRRQQNGPT